MRQECSVGVHECIEKQSTFFSKLVQERRGCSLVTITTQVVKTAGIERDQHDVWANPMLSVDQAFAGSGAHGAAYY